MKSGLSSVSSSGFVLVTGSSGFLGARLCSVLEATGTAWIGVDLRAPAPTLRGRGRTRRADLRDPLSLARALDGLYPTVVVHLAAQASPARSFLDPEGTRETNVEGTRHLLDHFLAKSRERRGYRPRLILASSAAVYGARRPRPGGIHESTPPRPISPYAVSKRDMERLAISYRDRTGFDVVITRSFNQIGAGQGRGPSVADWVRRIARAEFAGGPCRLLVGNLSPVRDFFDARIGTECYLELIARRPPETVYNLGSGSGRAMREILDRVVAGARTKVEVIVSRRKFRAVDEPWLAADTGRMRRDLYDCGAGATERFTIDSAIRDMFREARSAERRRARFTS